GSGCMSGSRESRRPRKRAVDVQSMEGTQEVCGILPRIARRRHFIRDRFQRTHEPEVLDYQARIATATNHTMVVFHPKL
ncbi:hypothetical protein PFISCL1PPCAC_27810, partial [Pristionchus fissidentatus]